MNNQLVKRANQMTPRQMARSLRSMELVIQGKTWKEIGQDPDAFSWSKFSRMLAQYPELGQAYQEARALSGTTFEDKALELADRLAGPNVYSGTGVRAIEVAMNQYRWSATKRDPRSFAEATVSTGSVVPIQINTTLNIGQGGEFAEQSKSVFDVQAEVLAAGNRGEQATEPSPEAVDVEGEIIPEAEETPPNGLAAELEDVRQKVHLPLEVKKAVKRRESPGRPPKRHKNAHLTSITATSYAKMKKSPAVRRALGLEDDANGPSKHAGVEPADPKPVSGSPKR